MTAKDLLDMLSALTNTPEVQKAIERLQRLGDQVAGVCAECGQPIEDILHEPWRMHCLAHSEDPRRLAQGAGYSGA